LKSLTSFDVLDLPSKSYDAVVVGSGAAGLFCGIVLRKLGLKTVVLTKSSATESSTNLAQGGIAVALPKEDSPELHFKDTVRAGAGLVDEKVARLLTEEGVERVVDLIRMGAQFERDERGLLKFTREAAHTVPRIIYNRDRTGQEVQRVLLSAYSGELVEGARLRELLVKEGRCFGALVEEKGELVSYYAPVVIVATGGAAGLYKKNTNPPTSTGDGIAAALRWGALLQDLEFVQFHPTAFCSDGECFLISEAVRGEGALLVDKHGRRFMGDYHHLWELAPRDVVTRAIELQKEITGGEVYLDMTHAELRDRQEFAFEAALRMRDRFLQQEVWERMGADVKKVIPLAYADPLRQEFQQLLFTKIVPNCKKLGLLDGGDGWLRKKFGEIGVIQYEDWVDTAEEVDAFAITRELEAEAAANTES
jgi:L-aspartate oxidase